MRKQLTKKELLKRLKSIDDDVVLTPDILSKLTIPDDSPNMIRTLNVMNDNEPINGDFIIRDFVKTRKNATEIDSPGIGILPDDLDHPLSIYGMGWSTILIEKGYFPLNVQKYLSRGETNEEIFKDIDKFIKNNEWIHTYIFSVEQVLPHSFFNETDTICTTIKMIGVTQEYLDWAKEKGNLKDTITWVDKAVEYGINIEIPKED